MEDNLVYLIAQLLQSNQIAFDKAELTFQIKSHPSYPSLHAITGVLSHFNIENIALDIPVDMETLAQLPKSFLGQINTELGKELILIKNDGLFYNLQYSMTKKEYIPLDEFLERFTGLLVAVEKSEFQETYKNTSSFIGTSLIILLALFAIGLLYLSKPSIISIVYFGFSLLGIYTSIAIVKQAQGLKSSLGEAFCTGNNEKKDCDTVINSKGATFFGIIKLGDMSLVFFTGLAVATYLLLLQENILSYPYAISILAFPITFYSIYYQYAVVKKWCMLCLSVVLILWAQVAVAVFDYNTITAFYFSNSEVVIVGFSFIVTLIIWYFLAPNISLIQNLKQSKIDFFRFKRNFNLFQTLLNKSKTLDTDIHKASEIIFGNKNTDLAITIITNPFCGHCKSVHSLVENILDKHKDILNIIIRFNVSTKNIVSDTVKITSRLLEIYHTEGEKKCLQAMHDIYDGKSVTSWLNEWGRCYEPQEYIEVLKKESDWCIQQNVNFTPEILINGKSFPKDYDRSDLLFFIEELDEFYLENNSEEFVLEKIR